MVHPSAWPEKKGVGEQLAALSYTAGRCIQTMTAILKGNLYDTGNLDIRVSKPRRTQDKYIHIFHHIRNNNPEPQMTLLSLSLSARERAGGGGRQGEAKQAPHCPSLGSGGLGSKPRLCCPCSSVRHRCAPGTSRSVEVSASRDPEGREFWDLGNSPQSEAEHLSSPVIAKFPIIARTSLCSGICPWTYLKPAEAMLHTWLNVSFLTSPGLQRGRPLNQPKVGSLCSGPWDPPLMLCPEGEPRSLLRVRCVGGSVFVRESQAQEHGPMAVTLRMWDSCWEGSQLGEW